MKKTITFDKELLLNIMGLPTFPMRLALETFWHEGQVVLSYNEVFEFAELSTVDVYQAEDAVSALKLGRIYFGNIIKCEYIEDVEDVEDDVFVFWVNDDLIKGEPTEPAKPEKKKPTDPCDFDCDNCECGVYEGEIFTCLDLVYFDED